MSDEPSRESSPEPSAELDTGLPAELRTGLSAGLPAELDTALREFAADHETPPVLSGSEVRGRAVRRARRRMAGTLGAAAAALAVVAFALTLDLDSAEGGQHGQHGERGNQRQIPAATPPVPSPSATSDGASPAATPEPAAGTVDLHRRTLTVGDRVMPMASGFANTPTFAGPMTVYQKHDLKILTVTNGRDETRYNAEVSYVVELRDAGNEPVYVGTALAYNVKDIGTYDTSSGWIGLDQADAKWFYEHAAPGDVLSTTG